MLFSLFMYYDIIALSDPVRPVGRLIFDSRIPPAAKMDLMRGVCEIQPVPPVRVEMTRYGTYSSLWNRSTYRFA